MAGNRPLATQRTVEGLPVCKCGHPREAHGPQEYPRGQAKCLATVKGVGAASDFYYPCHCNKFKEAE